MDFPSLQNQYIKLPPGRISMNQYELISMN